MSSSSKQIFIDNSKSFVAIILLRFMALLPLPVSQKAGAFLGKLMFLVNSRETRVARINIQLCFPEKSEHACKSMLESTVTQSGMLAAEIAFVWFRQPGEALRYISGVEGEQHLAVPYQEGKGVIVILPHLGNWEFLNAYILSKYQGSAMYTPAQLDAVNKVMVAGRERTGLKLEEANAKGVMGLLRALRAGRALFILPDQEPPSGSGEFAPFFGIQAFTMTLVSKLAKKTKAPVVIAYAKRRIDGSFDIVFKHVEKGISDSDMQVSLKALNAAVEDCIRDVPDQYMWAYKRFRKRPAGEKEFYLKKGR